MQSLCNCKLPFSSPCKIPLAFAAFTLSAAHASGVLSITGFGGSTGAGASTTGTVYGVYDDRYEYMMGNMVNKDGKFKLDSSAFTIEPLEKYYIKYSYSIDTENDNIKLKGKLGDATKEILKRFNNYSSDGYDTWFDKTLRATNTKWPWQVRTSWPGITSSSGGADMNLTTRPVLVIERKMPWLKNA